MSTATTPSRRQPSLSQVLTRLHPDDAQTIIDVVAGPLSTRAAAKAVADLPVARALGYAPTATAIHRWRVANPNVRARIGGAAENLTEDAEGTAAEHAYDVVSRRVSRRTNLSTGAVVEAVTETLKPLKDFDPTAIPAAFAAARATAPSTRAFELTSTPRRLGLLLPGDPQVGKVASRGGSVELIRRWDSLTAQALDHMRTRPLTHAHLGDLGDIIEGWDSAGGKGVMTDDLSLMQQVDLATTLMWETWVAMDDIVSTSYSSVPSNHAALRKGAVQYGDPAQDDWGIHIAKTLKRLAEVAGREMTVILPRPWEETVELNFAGHKVAMVHGHRGNLRKVATGQALNGGPLSDAVLRVTGHLHHLVWQQMGRTSAGLQSYWLQVPAMDGGSDWFEAMGGDNSDSGLVYIEVTEDGVDPTSMRMFQVPHELRRPRPEVIDLAA